MSENENNKDSSSPKIYLDYNATTPLDEQVLDEITGALRDAWGNPSSTHSQGLKAKNIIEKARENVAHMIGASPSEIIFTSGGTEANNMILCSVLTTFYENHGKYAKPHFITSKMEHDSVKLVLEHFQRTEKAVVTYIAVSKKTGTVDVEDIVSAVCPSTVMISVMMANNETGVIQPIAEISERVNHVFNSHRQPENRILIHTDAAQTIGKVPVDIDELGVDYLTIVGHKFYGPRIGAVYSKSKQSNDDLPLCPLLFGGGQERNYRPGTENTGMIAGLGKAAELVCKHLSEYSSHFEKLRDHLEKMLLENFECYTSIKPCKYGYHWNRLILPIPVIPRFTLFYLENPMISWSVEAIFRSSISAQQWLIMTTTQDNFGDKVHFNGKFETSKRIPNTCNVSFIGQNLEGYKILSKCKKIQASTRSACHAQNGPSPILLDLGIPSEIANNALRMSIGRETTLDDVNEAVLDLKQAVGHLLDSS